MVEYSEGKPICDIQPHTTHDITIPLSAMYAEANYVNMLMSQDWIKQYDRKAVDLLYVSALYYFTMSKWGKWEPRFRTLVQSSILGCINQVALPFQFRDDVKQLSQKGILTPNLLLRLFIILKRKPEWISDLEFFRLMPLLSLIGYNLIPYHERLIVLTFNFMSRTTIVPNITTEHELDHDVLKAKSWVQQVLTEVDPTMIELPFNKVVLFIGDILAFIANVIMVSMLHRATALEEKWVPPFVDHAYSKLFETLSKAIK